MERVSSLSCSQQLPLVSVLTQSKPVHFLPSYFFKAYLIISLIYVCVFQVVSFLTFLCQNPVCIFLLPACVSHTFPPLFFLYLKTRMISGDRFWSWSSLSFTVLQLRFAFSVLNQNFFLTTLFSNNQILAGLSNPNTVLRKSQARDTSSTLGEDIEILAAARIDHQLGALNTSGETRTAAA